jgi:hypothetical protein
MGQDFVGLVSLEADSEDQLVRDARLGEPGKDDGGKFPAGSVEPL